MKKRPKNCECDNTHEQNHTCCRPCWDAGFRTAAPGDWEQSLEKIGGELPNLDGFVSPQEAQQAVLKLEELERAVILLQGYAETKVQAMRFRQSGNIDVAKRYEETLAAYYRLLPDWARW